MVLLRLVRLEAERSDWLAHDIHSCAVRLEQLLLIAADMDLLVLGLVLRRDSGVAATAPGVRDRRVDDLVPRLFLLLIQRRSFRCVLHE